MQTGFDRRHIIVHSELQVMHGWVSIISLSIYDETAVISWVNTRVLTVDKYVAISWANTRVLTVHK